jgi:hypothetical protein
MNKLTTLLTAALVLGATFTNAQTVPDQNPRYLESQNKYARHSDSLLINQGTTFQQTYKAYDYVQLKQERKDQRREQRYQLKMARATSNYSYYDRWNNNGRWNNYYNSYLGRPSIGFRTGNWWFGW